MIVQLNGHEADFALADVLRLFFGPVSRSDAHTLTAGSEPWFIQSVCQQPVARPAEPAAGQYTPATGQVGIQTHLWLSGEDYAAGRSPFLALANAVEPQDARRELKRQLYLVLERMTDVHFPWGSLTGVRPTQLVQQLIPKAPSLNAVHAELVETWRLTPARADLAIRTALSEQRVHAQLPDRSPLIYVGIPFCPGRCAYCSFISQDAYRLQNLLAPYVQALLREARATFAPVRTPSPSLYIGGGTPTSLPEPLLAELLTGLQAILPLTADAEITVEAGRPDTIDAGKLRILREFGTTRLCINPQTFLDTTLQRIGRRHTAEQTVQAVRLAREAGFDHINMDLIAGLPGETAADFAFSLERTLDLTPESVTIHTLAVKRSSRLSQELDAAGRGELAINRPDPVRLEMLIRAEERLAETGYFPYYLYRQKDQAGGLENVGYARVGHECRYNVGMMSDQRPVIGLGSGAMSKQIEGRKVRRVPNDKDIAHYMARLDELIARKQELFAI